MSRRKQSNPKPLKYEENWNEAEEGRKSDAGKAEEGEKDAVDGCSSPASSSRIASEADEAGKAPEESGDELMLSGESSKPRRGSRDERILVSCVKSEKVFIKTEKVDEDESDVKVKGGLSGPTVMRRTRRESQGERGTGSPDDQGHSSPSLSSGCHRESPGPSEGSNPPPDHHYSHEQLIQAGLPYLHLLPPSIRNDAARFFFMPPNVSPELTAAAVAAMSSSPTETTHLQHKGKKLMSESPIPRVGPVYMCEPCNIKFSSSRTLEAHQTYYCSSRKELGDKDAGEGKSDCGGESGGDSRNDLRESLPVVSVCVPGGRKRERESSGEEAELSIDEKESRGDGGVNPDSAPNSNSNVPASNKNIKTGKLYSCSYCSYSADKKVSLNRHMRMHSGGPPPGTNGNVNSNNGEIGSSTAAAVAGGRNPAEGITAADRYCFDCEIQFTSLKTFKVHKQYYCSTRHVMKAAVVGPSMKGPAEGGGPLKPVQGAPSPHGSITPGLKLSGAGSPVTPEGSPIPIGSPLPPQPFVVLPTNPVIIVPYCFIQGASIVPGNLLPSSNALIIMPNGSVQSLAGTQMPMPISMSFPSPSGGLGGGGPLMAPYGPPQMSPGSTTNPTNLSPPGQHSVFNDPKDVIRRIAGSGGARISASSGEPSADSHLPAPSRARSARSAISAEKEVSAGPGSGEMDEGPGDESIPAIDLTLRNFIKTEEDEKENRRCTRREVQSHSYSPHDRGSSTAEPRNEDISQRDVELRHELSAANSSHSGSGGRRTPRPASISSSCSSSPAPIYAPDHKLNGLKGNRGGTNLHHPYTSPGPITVHSDGYSNGARPKSKGDGILASKLRGGAEKISPVSTQLPGGAILTTASNQSLAELLMSNPPDLTESLAKLNSHLVMTSPPPGVTGLGAPFDPAAMMAAAASLPPDLAMTYLANIQHSLQQQHHHLQAAKHQHQQHAATVKRGVWKCVDCEIVFYKQENFLVHKEQYCASRSAGTVSEASGKGISTKENCQSHAPRGGGFKSKESQFSKGDSAVVSRSSSRGGESPPLPCSKRSTQLSPRSGESPLSSSKSPPPEIKGAGSDFRVKPDSPASPATTPNHISAAAEAIPTSTSSSPPSPFLCQKCGVKYSTLDNLSTHQTFYCNKRPGAGDAVVSNGGFPPPPPRKPSPPSAVEGGENRGGFARCGRCNLAIPEEQMTVHKPVCHGQINGSLSAGNGPSSSSGGWKCPCCDTYSPTMSAAQKHLETHTGIRAFKCVICGYRGNTLRGMRTHIRMHFDKRFSDLQEGDYISCITATDLEASGGGANPAAHSPLAAAGTVNGALNKRRNRVTLVG